MKDTAIQKAVHKINLRDQKSDFAYWQSQPPAALEQIRREYHGWRYGAEPRFQRVFTIV
jgi:hypothetical protein